MPPLTITLEGPKARVRYHVAAGATTNYHNLALINLSLILDHDEGLMFRWDCEELTWLSVLSPSQHQTAAQLARQRK